eukprot:6201151-Pleurochrysis_carterae.AAC.2
MQSPPGLFRLSAVVDAIRPARCSGVTLAMLSGSFSEGFWPIPTWLRPVFGVKIMCSGGIDMFAEMGSFGIPSGTSIKSRQRAGSCGSSRAGFMRHSVRCGSFAVSRAGAGLTLGMR